MKKKLLCFLLLFIVFFSGSLDVKALSNEGYCIYNIKDDYSVMIKQDSNDNVTYYHALEKVIDVNSDSWIVNGASDVARFKKYNLTVPYTSCPKYAVYYDKGEAINLNRHVVTFSNVKDIGSNVEVITVEPTSDSGLKIAEKNSGGFGATCAETNIDWMFSADDYDVSCLYSYDSSMGCAVVQLSWNGDGTIRSEGNYKNWNPSYDTNVDKYLGGGNGLLNTYGVSCPVSIGMYMTSETDYTGGSPVLKNVNYISLHTKNNGTGIFWQRMDLNKAEPEEQTSIKLLGDKKGNYTCEEIINGDTRDILKDLITLIRVLVPIILVAMGVVDFGSAVFAGDEDKMKKSQSKFIKRLLIAVVIFLIPVLLKFILKIAYEIWEIVDPTLCGLI